MNLVDPLGAARPAPSYDPELLAHREAHPEEWFPKITLGMIPELRRQIADGSEAALKGRNIDRIESVVPGASTRPDLEVTILLPRGRAGPVPTIYHVHGGGMIIGNRLSGLNYLIDWVERYGIGIVTPEYRLAPEYPDPEPIEDGYAGLLWTATEAASMGLDPARMIVCGGSAGGGLAAGLALMARDRSGPNLLGQLLICPMLDDRNTTVSSHQYTDRGGWDREANQIGWRALLGDRIGGPEVTHYAVPARCTDLSGLPPAFIDVGSAEIFRDEAVAYATAIWESGGSADLHVWSGGYHGFDHSPSCQARIAVAARQARDSWIRRIFSL